MDLIFGVVLEGKNYVIYPKKYGMVAHTKWGTIASVMNKSHEICKERKLFSVAFGLMLHAETTVYHHYKWRHLFDCKGVIPDNVCVF